MTADTAAPSLKPWRHEIKYGPDGEASYAWVYDGDSNLVCTAKTHHAKAIVERMNTRATPTPTEARERIAQVFDGWLAAYEHGDPIQYTPAREYAAGAVRDCQDAVLKILALLPDAAAIRAAAFEEAAKIAEDDERQDEWPKSVDVTRTSPSRIMQQTIAAALRNAGRTG